MPPLSPPPIARRVRPIRQQPAPPTFPRLLPSPGQTNKTEPTERRPKGTKDRRPVELHVAESCRRHCLRENRCVQFAFRGLEGSSPENESQAEFAPKIDQATYPSLLGKGIPVNSTGVCRGFLRGERSVFGVRPEPLTCFSRPGEGSRWNPSSSPVVSRGPN